MSPSLSRVVYASRDAVLRRELAETLGRKLLEEREEDSFFRRLKKALSPSFVERWARTHGPDSAQVGSALKGGVPLIFEAAANVGFTWAIDREMKNRSSEELAVLARTVLGKTETCEELVFLLHEQAKNPTSFDSRLLALAGDFRLVRGILSILSHSLILCHGAAEIALEFDGEPPPHENGQLIGDRDCEVIGKLIDLSEPKLRCFALWV